MRLQFALRAIVALVFLSILPGPTFADGPGTRKVVIVLPASHPAMEEIITSMQEELARLGFRDEGEITYGIYNAGGDPNKFTAVAQSAISANPDLIVALATPTARAAVKENAGRLPVVFSAVTDPVGAGIVASLDSPGGNVTGVSDAWPYEAQLRLIRDLCPDAKRLGIVYNPAEENSAYGMAIIRDSAPDLGFQITERTVANEGEVAAAASSLVGRIDVFYITSDNVAVSQAPTIVKAGTDNGIPVFAGDSGTVEKGALGAVSVGYSGVGIETGRLVKRILDGESAGAIPVIVAKDEDIHLNLDTAYRVGLELPSTILAAATKTYGTGSPGSLQRSSYSVIYTAIAGALVVLVIIIVLRSRQRKHVGAD